MKSSTNTRILLVEDDPVTAAALARKLALQPHVELVNTLSNVTDAKAYLAHSPIDVLLTDLDLPDGDGTDVIAELVRLQPNALAMVISVFGGEQHVVRAIRAGASGYLLKDDTAQEIGEAIASLVSGISPISPMIAHHLIKALQPKAQANNNEDTVDLSDRELEVLTLAAKGFTYAEIADVLGVSINTVSSYTRRVYSKLAVTSKTEAIYEASRMGLMGDS